MGNLINLRHLLNWGCNSIGYMPKSLERLTDLRTLDEFATSEGSYGSKECSVECLKNFKHLREIRIFLLGNLRDVGEVRRIEFNKMKNLRFLGAEFDGRMNENENEKHEQLLEALQPPPNLEELGLGYYKGNTIPDWMMSLTNLRKLVLWDCINCEHLPSLGKLLSLEILLIREMKNVKRVGNEFLGIESDAMSTSSSIIVFSKLKYLRFWGMKEWEEWNYEITKRGDEDITVMPSLQTLEIRWCPKLKSLPNHLHQMTTLKKKIYNCPLLEEQRTDS